MAVKASPQAGSQGESFPGVDNGQFIEYLFFTLAITGSYVAGGDPLNFQGVSDLLKSGGPPIQCNIWSQSAAVGHSGFIYFYRPGTPATQANGKMQVLATGNGNQQALAEIAAGTYPAAVTADTVVGMACFIRT